MRVKNHDFSDALIEADPKNLISYLAKLAKTMESEDERAVDEIMQRMSETEYADRYYGHKIKDIKQLISLYVEETPSPLSQDDSFDQIAYLYQIDEYRDVLEQAFIENYKANHINSITLNYLVSSYMIPQYRTLFDNCKNLNYQEQCLKIANIMKANITTYKISDIGFGLESNVLKQLDKEKHIESVYSNAKRRKSYTCHTQGIPAIFTIVFPVYSDYYFENFRSQGELETHIEATHLLVNELKIKNVNLGMDFSKCEQIKKMSNEEYFETYGENDFILKYSLEDQVEDEIDECTDN